MSNNGNGRVDFAARRAITIVDVPELETTFTLRALSRKQLDSLKGEDNTTSNLLAASIVDPSTLQPIYSAEEIGEMSITASAILADALGKLNGFSKEAIEEAAKKSAASPSTASVSA